MVGQMDIEPSVRLGLILREDGTVELMKPRFARIADVAGIGRGKPVRLSPRETRTAAHAERWRGKLDRSE